jgi:succinate dehydrogenase/fumarate reductase flavoprotein subunit
MKLKEQKIAQVVIGSGAAGFQSALRLYQNGEWDLTVVTENINAGTSRNTGSDKQTYYKLTLSGKDPDSVENMAEDLFAGQCVDGDQALCEAALLPLQNWGFLFHVQNRASLWDIRQTMTGEGELPAQALILQG